MLMMGTTLGKRLNAGFSGEGLSWEEDSSGKSIQLNKSDCNLVQLESLHIKVDQLENRKLSNFVNTTHCHRF